MGEMGDQSHRYNCLCFFTEADCHNKLCDQTPMLYLTNKKAGFGFLLMVFFFLQLSSHIAFCCKETSFVVSWFCCLGFFTLCL